MLKELRFEVNKACNYRCIHCYTDKRGHDVLDDTLMEVLIRDVAAHGATDLSLTGGEPLLEWRRVLAIAGMAKSQGLAVRLNTNGHLLTGEVVDALVPFIEEFQVSLNGADAESFDRFVRYPGAFLRVTSGITRLVAAGAYVTIRYTLMAETAAALLETFQLGERLGIKGFKVRVVVPAEPIAPCTAVAALRDASARLFAALPGSPVEVRFNDGGLGLSMPALPNLRFLSCLCGADALFVGSDGEVAPCPFLREYGAYRLGNVSDTPLSAIYETSDTLKAFIGQKAEGCGNEQGHGCRASDLCSSQLNGEADAQAARSLQVIQHETDKRGRSAAVRADFAGVRD